AHAIGSSSNLKPIFCKPASAALPYCSSISLAKLGAKETGSTCSSVSGTIMTSRRPSWSEILRKLRFSPRGTVIMSNGSSTSVCSPRSPHEISKRPERQKKFSTVLRWRCRPGPFPGSHSAMLTIRPRGPLTGAPALRPLVIRRSHHRIDPTCRYFFHCARRNVVRLKILSLVGLELVESSDAGFHLFGSKRSCSHGGSLPFARRVLCSGKY